MRGGQLAGSGDQVGPSGGRGVQDGDAGQVQALEERAVLGVGDQDLAVGAQDVGGQALAPPSGVVDAGGDVAAESPPGGQGDEHVRGVPEQSADVHRARRVGHGQHCGRGLLRVADVLAPRPPAAS